MKTDLPENRYQGQHKTLNQCEPKKDGQGVRRAERKSGCECQGGADQHRDQRAKPLGTYADVKIADDSLMKKPEEICKRQQVCDDHVQCAPAQGRCPGWRRNSCEKDCEAAR